MDTDFFDYVHVRHFDVFVEAAHRFRYHILVRKTGRASLQYCGLSGYTGKRGDMKAKTAAKDVAPYKLQGLVCSPLIHPGACKPDARQYWRQSAHLITTPKNGFDDNVQPRGCLTPYMLQTNRNHKHYGCIAWVENGLLLPRYVHGDYDLYAIVPAGTRFDPSAQPVRRVPMTGIMDPPGQMGLAQRLARDKQLHRHSDESAMLLQVSSYLNLRIARTEPGLPNALMVNHGEQISLKGAAIDHQPVLAFLAEPRDGKLAMVLPDRAAHDAFFRSV